MTREQEIALEVLETTTEFERKAWWKMLKGDHLKAQMNEPVFTEKEISKPVREFAENKAYFHKLFKCDRTDCRFCENGKCKSMVATEENCNMYNRWKYFEEK